MRYHRVRTLSILLICGILLQTNLAWSSTSGTLSIVDEESIAGAPAPSTPLKENRRWDAPKGLRWEHRFFDKPLAALNFRQNQFRLPSASGIPLKTPGTFPGIELGVEMHSFQALQSVVPQESFSKLPNDQQSQPLLLSPTIDSPDYNGGFLRFTW